jgi:hypothetical protein
MRAAGVFLVQIAVATLAIAAIGAVIGSLIAYFALNRSAALGAGWGMVVAGAFAAMPAGSGGRGTLAWRRHGGAPRSPLLITFAGLLAFGGGPAVRVFGAY